MKEEREKILKKLMHNQIMTFNQIWAKEGESNNFAYHLKVLEEDGLVQKNDKGYSLTHEGKKRVAYIDGSTGSVEKAPIIGVIVAVYNEEKDEFLMSRRAKEPFYGYAGFIGGKIKLEQYILECAKDELLEETGLTCELELKGIFSSKTFNDNKLSFNHQMFIVKATNPKGKLITKTREGENFWCKQKDISKLKVFPNIPEVAKIVKAKGFGWLEEDRNQINEEFKSVKIHKNLKL